LSAIEVLPAALLQSSRDSNGLFQPSTLRTTIASCSLLEIIRSRQQPAIRDSSLARKIASTKLFAISCWILSGGVQTAGPTRRRGRIRRNRPELISRLECAAASIGQSRPDGRLAGALRLEGPRSAADSDTVTPGVQAWSLHESRWCQTHGSHQQDGGAYFAYFWHGQRILHILHIFLHFFHAIIDPPCISVIVIMILLVYSCIFAKVMPVPGSGRAARLSRSQAGPLNLRLSGQVQVQVRPN
jgi:hypothetical protein